MAKNREKLAGLLGAKIVGQVPDVGSGAFGMARLAHILHQRLTPSQGERPGRPTNPNWVLRPKVPMSEATAAKLAQIADALSTPERKISPMQVAAQLLEEALSRVQGNVVPDTRQNEFDRQEPASDDRTRAEPELRTQARDGESPSPSARHSKA
jgi:hypothetical protein